MINDEPGIDIRKHLLDDYDVRHATVHHATEGMLPTVDLWWLYDEHRIMAPADAWLLAAMWEDNIPEDLVEQTLGSPGWWSWFDRGITEARLRNT